MRSISDICIALLLCSLITCTASHAQAASKPTISAPVGTLAGTFAILPIPDTLPGDPIRFQIDFSVRLFSISFAWGSVTYTGAKQEKLILQLKTVRAGDHSFSWDSIVPSGATGEATVVITYLGLPGGITRETTSFKITQNSGSSQDYTGSSRCISCHAGFNPDIVDAYTQSGHYFALNAVAGQSPAYPSFAAGIPGPPPGNSWSDIAYVISGYAWFANFALTDNGTILTGPEAKYNLPSSFLGTAAAFAAYSPDTPDPARFDCGPCHATGYTPHGNQGGLPDISGSWVESGVGCEACHGPGSTHAASPYGVKPDLSSGIRCVDCHVRLSTSVVEASGGLILHQQQAAELKSSLHSFMQCTLCHAPHASAHYDDEASGTAIVTECISCHPDITVGLNMAHLACIDCHMPYAVKAGASTTFTDPALDEYVLGDMRSHVFKVYTDAPSPADMFTDDGTKLAVGDYDKTPGLTLNFVCLGCHRPGGQAATSYTYEVMQSSAKYVHAQQ